MYSRLDIIFIGFGDFYVISIRAKCLIRITMSRTSLTSLTWYRPGSGMSAAHTQSDRDIVHYTHA